MSRKQLNQVGGGVAALVALTVVTAVVWNIWSAETSPAGAGAAQAPGASAEPRAPQAPAGAPPVSKLGESAWAKAPEAFDPAKIDADPGYYTRADPTRTFQHAPVPAGKKRHEDIRLLSEPMVTTQAHSKLAKPLAVSAKPNRPVTFFAVDSGKFSNGEQSITVKADAKGVAEADFWVTNEGYYRVLVGSPENHGPVTISVTALSDKQLAAFQAKVGPGR